MKWNFLYQFTAASRTLDYGGTSPDPRSLCPLPSTKFVEPPPEKNPGYATDTTHQNVAHFMGYMVRLFMALCKLGFVMDQSAENWNCQTTRNSLTQLIVTKSSTLLTYCTGNWSFQPTQNRLHCRSTHPIRGITSQALVTTSNFD